MTQAFQIKGWHVLAALLAMFGLVIVVNLVYVVVAIESFPGEDAPRAYAQGLNYNQTLAERAEQRALKWRAVVAAVRHASGDADVIVTILDSQGHPLTDLTVNAVLRRATQETEDRALNLVETTDGYQASVVALEAGQWDLRFDAHDPLGHSFSGEKRLWLP